MRNGLLLCALWLLAGCSHEYYMRIDGDVRGADRDTPRAVKADVYEGRSGVRALGDAASGSLAPVPAAKVFIGLRFNDEAEGRATSSVPVDSRTAHFHFESAGKEKSRLTAVQIRVEAPGYDPVEKTLLVPKPESHHVEKDVLAVLDPAGPSPPASTDRQPPIR